MKSGVFGIAEQIESDVPASRLVGVQPDEAYQAAAARVDFGPCDRLPQIVRLALPLVRRVEPDAFLRFVIVGQGERGQLVERDAVRAQVIEGYRVSLWTVWQARNESDLGHSTDLRRLSLRTA